MAKSIKLSDDNYWDTSGLHGGQIFNSYGTINGNTSKAITVPNGFRGIIFLFRGSATMAAYMVIATSGGAVYFVPIIEGNNISVAANTNKFTVTLNSSTNVYCYYIGNNMLS